MVRNDWIRRLFKLAGAGIIFVAVLELSARIDDSIRWGAPLWGNYSEEMLSVSDSLGWHNRPNAKYQKWEINSYGFRGPEFDRDKPDSVTRIIVVGASETFGLYESPGMEYPAQMQAMLDSLQPGRYQVLNAACPGMSPPRINHYFNVWLKDFHPDILAYYPSPSFYLLRRPPADSVITRSMPPPSDFSLRIRGKISVVAKRFLPAGLQEFLRRRVIEQAVNNHPDDWVFREVPEAHLRKFEEHLGNLVSNVEANGTQIVIATHGTRISGLESEDDRRYLTVWRKLYPHVQENVFLEMETAGNKVIESVGQQLSVPVVDLNSRLPKTTQYYADHLHFTDEGAREVAKAFVSQILIMESELAKASSE